MMCTTSIWENQENNRKSYSDFQAESNIGGYCWDLRYIDAKEAEGESCIRRERNELLNN